MSRKSGVDTSHSSAAYAGLKSWSRIDVELRRGASLAGLEMLRLAQTVDTTPLRQSTSSRKATSMRGSNSGFRLEEGHTTPSRNSTAQRLSLMSQHVGG
jgi:hypothetical protein